jgi:hypothetical protein
MKSLLFDAFAFKQSLVDADVSEQQANAITQAFSTAIQESNANLIEIIKRQYRLDDGVTKHDLRLLERKQDDEAEFDCNLRAIIRHSYRFIFLGDTTMTAKQQQQKQVAS